jgi:hypothetical protein
MPLTNIPENGKTAMQIITVNVAKPYTLKPMKVNRERMERRFTI